MNRVLVILGASIVLYFLATAQAVCVSQPRYNVTGDIKDEGSILCCYLEDKK